MTLLTAITDYRKFADQQTKVTDEMLAIMSADIPATALIKNGEDRSGTIGYIVDLQKWPIFTHDETVSSTSWHYGSHPFMHIKLTADIRLIRLQGQHVKLENTTKKDLKVYMVFSGTSDNKQSFHVGPPTYVPGFSTISL